MTALASFARPLRAQADGDGYRGWAIGAALGVVLGIAVIPAVRTMVRGQLLFALLQRQTGWLAARDVRTLNRELTRLDTVASERPDDYFVQVGRATLLAGALRPSSPFEQLPQRTSGHDMESDRTLLRLALLARELPATPGAFAHFARYMVANRLRIERPDPGPLSVRATSRTIRAVPARHTDVDLMEWALRSGARRQPDNAFWPAMLAVTYTAAMRDEAAMRELRLAAQKSYWNSYLYEEVLGQWRLFAAAYGDTGAAQKATPLTLIAFPHLSQIRRMAEIARARAEMLERSGHATDAARIRISIAWLGKLMRETAPWALEALYGADLVLIATTEPGHGPTVETIRALPEWETQSQPVLESLRGTYYVADGGWLRHEAAQCLALRRRIDVARSDAAFAGVPPGIPLQPLLGDWMMGVALLQEVLLLLLAAAIARWWPRGRTAAARWTRWVWLPLATALAYIALTAPSPLVAGCLIIAIAMACVVGMELLYRLYSGRWAEALTAAGRGFAEGHWRVQTTARVAAGLLVVALAALWALRPVLAAMHPAAIALTGLIGEGLYAQGTGALLRATVAAALPAALLLVCGLWGLWMGISPQASATVGVRRTALPCASVLTVVYLALLSNTLAADAQASLAMEAAARSDLAWVLTHT